MINAIDEGGLAARRNGKAVFPRPLRQAQGRLLIRRASAPTRDEEEDCREGRCVILFSLVDWQRRSGAKPAAAPVGGETRMMNECLTWAKKKGLPESGFFHVRVRWICVGTTPRGCPAFSAHGFFTPSFRRTPESILTLPFRLFHVLTPHGVLFVMLVSVALPSLERYRHAARIRTT